LQEAINNWLESVILRTEDAVQGRRARFKAIYQRRKVELSRISLQNAGLIPFLEAKVL
jgi:hypothetical protein